METALGIFILLTACVSIACGCYGIRLLQKLEKIRRKTLHKAPPPSMPRIYQGDMLDHLKNKPKLYSISLN